MHRLISFIDKFLAVERRKCPPDTLRILRIHRLVCVVHVYPAPHTWNDTLPFFVIRKHARACLVIEFLDTILLNVFLLFQSEFFFNQVLNGKSVTIPSPLTSHITPAHRLITRNNVFNRTLKKVPMVRQTRCKGWSIIKNIGFFAVILS